MRILHWLELFGNTIGGVEVLVANLLRASRLRGHDLAIVTSHIRTPLPDEERFEGIPLHRFHFQEALLDRDIKRIGAIRRRVSELKRDFAPQIVHFHFAGLTLNAFFHLHTTRSRPVPTLVTLHGLGPELPSRAPLISELLTSGEWIAAVSGAVLEQARAFEPSIVPRSSVVHNGLPPGAEAPPPPSGSPPSLLCLGRLTSEKGFDVAVRAFARVVTRVPGTRLVVAGDGPERPGLRDLAASLGIASAVEFPGWIPPHDVSSRIDDASVVLVPSRYEAFGLTALEAAQRSRPVVATRVGGLPEVVLDGETGLLVESEDERAMAEAVVSLLEEPERAAQLGRAARERAAEAFGLERCLDAYTDLYERLVGRSG